MATTVDFIEYVCGQIEGTGAVRYKKMFGEYMAYVNDKPILLVCDNIVFVKKLPCLDELMADAEKGCPYRGAKEHYILDIDDAGLVREVVAALEPVTSLPKPRKKKSKQISIIDLIVETHIGLERQGPGSPEMTIKALSFMEDIDKISRVADLGCGTGGQTMVLAQNIAGNITGVDKFPEFINIFNDNAKKLNFQERVKGIVGPMENLSFQKEEFDLIWSEGAIDSIGFEKGLAHWNGFLKTRGYVAVTCPSWFTDERPDEIEKFWSGAGSGLDTIGHNISIMQKTGYSLVAAFALPEKCWTDDYFIPREAAEKALLERYAGNKTVESYIEDEKYEVELYSKYKQYYGYVFYIGRKI